MRIRVHPVLSFEDKKTVSFLFDGREYEGYEGEPIATALFAAGLRVFSKSHKHHRPRGLYCNIGNCSSCLATVDGRANVRICIEPLREGMTVRSQEGRGVLL